MTSPIVVLGAGAFGTALALVMAEQGHQIRLWGRPGATMDEIAARRENTRHLPGIPFPEGLQVVSDLGTLSPRAVVLLAVPTQSLREVVTRFSDVLAPHLLIACCKGVERGTGLLPSEVISQILPGAQTAVLTGPSFAADIAVGKPTALTLATRAADGAEAQALLSSPGLRIYLSDDPIGAQLGGALKNVIAIAAGMAIGKGLGDSARSALMTRGMAEMVRFAQTRGADPQTLFGLSGFGDLVLTCTSTQSRNFRFGISFGAGTPPETGQTVEGVMTAHAVAESAVAAGADLPITGAVSAILKGDLSLDAAIDTLMARPLRNEWA